MEDYLANYKSYTKHAVFTFSRGCGGVGDVLKFFIFLVQLCMPHCIRVHFLCQDESLNNVLRLKDPDMYISDANIGNRLNIDHMRQINDIAPGYYFMVHPRSMYDAFPMRDVDFNQIEHLASCLFFFPNNIICNANAFLDKHQLKSESYISIHIRLGDKFLENKPSIEYDVREYNEGAVFKFIEDNSSSKIILFCDSNAYKSGIKARYNFIYTTDFDIGHSGLWNTTDLQMLNSVTEFYLIANSTHIYKASYSGFSIMASKFYGTPIDNI